MQKEEKERFGGFLRDILEGEPPGTKASAFDLRMANETSTRANPTPHVRAYGGTVKDDGSVSVEKFHVPEESDTGNSK